MKILAFAGSSSSKSINRALVTYALNFVDTAEIVWIDLNNFEMPIYSVDRQLKDGIPCLAHDLRSMIQNSDAIICSLAEHNGAYSAAFKNIFDWLSRIDMNVFDQKPMLLMSTSPGKRGGSLVLELASKTFPSYGGNIVAKFSLPSFDQTFDLTTCSITDQQADKALKEQLAIWVKSIK